MDIKATIDKDSFGYRNRLLLIAAGALFWSGYCVYDALIAYPDQIRAYAAITQLKDDHPDDWRERWEEKAKANDWDPTSEPDKRTEGDILTQWLQFAIVFPIGTFCLFSVARWSSKHIGVDDDKLYANGGVEVPFEQITRIDASRWENKGIARVYYDLGTGEQNVLIDDFKYERQPADAIFARVKDAVDEDKVEGLSEADEIDETEPDASEPQAG